MGAWSAKRERPCPNMDYARSLDQSRGSSRSSQRFLSDRSQQRKELSFPARQCIRVNSHSQYDTVHPSAGLSSPLLSVTKPLAMHQKLRICRAPAPFRPESIAGLYFAFVPAPLPPELEWTHDPR